MYITPLHNLIDVDLYGAKAAHLSKMKRVGFPVPDGFVISTDAFFSFNFSSRRAASNKLCNSSFLNESFSSAINNEINLL